jgi:two-component system response regulator HydG
LSPGAGGAGVGDGGGFKVISISDDPTMKPVVRLVLKAAMCHANVLVYGESGVGKTYIARQIHAASPLASGDFYTVFCSPDNGGGAGTVDLVEILRSMECRRGTVFVKGIDLLGPMGQRALLGYLDDRERRVRTHLPLGGNGVRMVFSSQKDLRLESVAGRYLRQLYLRVSVVTIEVPPLRQREADIVNLAKHFLCLYSDREHKRVRNLSVDAEYLLRTLSWKGNIHELRNTMNRAVVLADEGETLSVGVLEGVIQQAD